MPCRYCKGEIEGGGRRKAHAECDAEWSRRYDEGLCTRCGGAEAEAYGPACSKCVDARGAMSYHNYPGGKTG